jgi:putative SOS response-associated peptidase YedK
MCGRFNVESDPLSRLLMELVGLPHPGPDNHNAAPTETLPVLRSVEGRPELVPMRWWLTPYWTKAPDTRYSMFNAKAETVEKSPAFREPFRKRRCVLPVSGFYEWARGPEPGQKLPYYLTAAEQPGLLIAGIWDHWRGAGDPGMELTSFAIITTSASERLEFVHHRQPVILAGQDAARWLDPASAAVDLKALMEPRVPVALEVLPVSTWVNNARHKDRRCIDPVGAPVAVGADSP